MAQKITRIVDACIAETKPFVCFTDDYFCAKQINQSVEPFDENDFGSYTDTPYCKELDEECKLGLEKSCQKQLGFCYKPPAEQQTGYSVSRLSGKTLNEIYEDELKNNEFDKPAEPAPEQPPAPQNDSESLQTIAIVLGVSIFVVIVGIVLYFVFR